MKKWLLWSIIILVIIAVGLGIYFLSGGNEAINQLNSAPSPPPLPVD